MNNKGIDNKDIIERIEQLETKAVPLKTKINADLNSLEIIYKEIIKLKKVLQENEPNK